MNSESYKWLTSYLQDSLEAMQYGGLATQHKHTSITTNSCNSFLLNSTPDRLHHSYASWHNELSLKLYSKQQQTLQAHAHPGEASVVPWKQGTMAPQPAVTELLVAALAQWMCIVCDVPIVLRIHNVVHHLLTLFTYNSLTCNL